MSRRKSLKVAQRNEALVEPIRALKAEHPFWGYRRVWAHLRYVDGQPVNKKRILRLMREHDLLVKPNLRLRAKRRIQTRKPKPTAPNAWWGIDMTKVMVGDFGWLYIVVVLDWYTKKVVGHYAGLQCRTWQWLVALNRAVNRQFPEGVRDQGLSLMADNGSQPTSRAFMAACESLGIRQAFTSYNNPKGNADTERMMRTLKEEFIWLREWKSPAAFIDELDAWIEYYNSGYLHSTLGYKTPMQHEHEYHTRHGTQLAAS
jgi:transposase InsO family protein